MIDEELYAEVVAVTIEIAKERGIFWEGEQAEIVYEVITNPAYLSRLKVKQATCEYGNGLGVHEAY